MKTTKNRLSLLLVLILVLTGCGGSGNGTAPGGGGGGGGGAAAGALDTGGSGLVLDQVAGAATTVNFSTAIDVNDLNQIIGFSEVTPGAEFTASLWAVNTIGTPSTAPSALEPVSGNTFSAAFALDETGVAVGQSSDGGRLVAVVWEAGNSIPTVLPELSATGNSSAFGISADGIVIVGEAQDATGTTRAVAWLGDGLGSFGAPVLLPVNVFAVGIDLSSFSSAAGVARVGTDEILIVGEAVAGDDTVHAALWRSTNAGATFAASDLGADFIAYAVNGLRQVAGERDSTLAPFTWAVDASGVAAAPVSLAAVGSAVAINENGRIAGWSGATDLATVWNGTTPATLFTTVSQAFGLNNEAEPLVVGRSGSQGFVKRVN